MTIIEAIKAVMRETASPMTARDAYDAIIARDLYTFAARDPRHVVLQQIRRHVLGVHFPSASRTKHFTINSQNRYFPLPESIRVDAAADPASP